MDDKEFYYDITKFETEMIASRGNFLLVFQSMLFGAVAALADKETFIPLWLLIGLGLATSIAWLYLNWLTNVIGEGALKKLRGIDNRVDSVLRVRDNNVLLRHGSVSWMMAFLFPIMTGIVWAVLLYNSLAS